MILVSGAFVVVDNGSEVMVDHVSLLIIDENPKVRTALEARLGMIPQIQIMGSVGSVAEAETALHEATPDVVLIEPKRLSGAGIELIQELTSTPKPPLVIVLTSYHDEDEELVTTELGIGCYMLKEIDSQALVDAILSCRKQSGLRAS
ncbi:MAG TPA: response regulator transcription factor [Aggregatilineales bacterium]|nr:response regulator transcription factor [Aggregatilineales bacterium]